MFPMTLTYNDITLVSRVMSSIPSRSIPDTTVSLEIGNTYLNFPVVAAPMDTVCNAEMAIALNKLGGLGIIHRFQTIEQQVKEVHSAIFTIKRKIVFFGGDFEIENVAFAIPTVNFEERLDSIIRAIRYHIDTPELLRRVRIWICVDTANGFHVFVQNVMNHINSYYDSSIKDRIIVMAGNVASAEGYTYLANLGVKAVRCGISGGSPCTTGIVTGVGQGIVSTVLECVEAKSKLPKHKQALIVADGGIQSSGDIMKALAIGADVIMMGSMLAGFKESPSPLRKRPRYLFRIFGDAFSKRFTGVPVLDYLLLSQNPKNWWKAYRGMASHTANEISNKLNNTNKRIVAEGAEHKVAYTGSIYDGLPLLQGGVKSGMSYFNAVNIQTLRENTQIPNSIVQQTYFAHIERSAFIKNNGL